MEHFKTVVCIYVTIWSRVLRTLSVIYIWIKQFISYHAASALSTFSWNKMMSSASLSKSAQVSGLVTDGEVPGLYPC